MNTTRRWYIANYHPDDSDGVLYWSNQYGWVTEDFTFFTDEEHEQFSLPMDGEWACVGGYEPDHRYDTYSED